MKGLLLVWDRGFLYIYTLGWVDKSGRHHNCIAKSSAILLGRFSNCFFCMHHTRIVRYYTQDVLILKQNWEYGFYRIDFLARDLFKIIIIIMANYKVKMVVVITAIEVVVLVVKMNVLVGLPEKK